MKAPILLALAGLCTSSVLADEPTGTLTLACTGTKTSQGGAAGTSSEQINRSIMVDFEKKSVMGLSDSRVAISNVDETTITLSGADTGWVMNGGIDRVTGSLYAVFNQVDPNTRQTILSISYDLQCQPAQ
jgi:hypothetical protein